MTVPFLPVDFFRCCNYFRTWGDATFGIFALCFDGLVPDMSISRKLGSSFHAFKLCHPHVKYRQKGTLIVCPDMGGQFSFVMLPRRPYLGLPRQVSFTFSMPGLHLRQAHCLISPKRLAGAIEASGLHGIPCPQKTSVILNRGLCGVRCHFERSCL